MFPFGKMATGQHCQAANGNAKANARNTPQEELISPGFHERPITGLFFLTNACRGRGSARYRVRAPLPSYGRLT